MKKILLLLILGLLYTNTMVLAFDFKDSFFVSLRAEEVNLRLGPGGEYPIKYTYKLKGMPLKVLGEYENWYKVIDKDNDEGWVNKNLTTKKRNLIVIDGTQILYAKNNVNSMPIFRLEENVILKYIKCDKEWCKVEVEHETGWLPKNTIWGH